MHGIIKPIQEPVERSASSRLEGLHHWARRHRAFLLIVIMPSLLAAIYYYLMASNQYQSEAHFVVRSAQSNSVPGSGISALLALGGGISETRGDAMSVVDFLDSSDAVNDLNKRLDLVSRFRRPDIDPLSRLQAEPTPEALLKYYRKRISVHFNDDTGITTLEARAFRPEDSYSIVRLLLKLGEERVNFLNRRSYQDALAMATRQLNESEDSLRKIQVAMTQFRQVNSDIDPEGSGRAQLNLVAQMTAGLVQARAQLQAMRGIINPASPQYIATAARVNALEAQIAGQRGKLAGSGNTIANSLGQYEDLRIRQEFAAKRYEAAAAAYETAREDARKKQLYLVHIVNPNLPVKSLYPERGRIVLTIFFSLLIAYGIGWLILAGVREHSNG